MIGIAENRVNTLFGVIDWNCREFGKYFVWCLIGYNFLHVCFIFKILAYVNKFGKMDYDFYNVIYCVKNLKIFFIEFLIKIWFK